MLYFWFLFSFLRSSSFLGSFTFLCRLLKLSISVVQKANAPKNGVEFHQKSIEVVNFSLASSYDAVRRRRFLWQTTLIVNYGSIALSKLIVLILYVDIWTFWLFVTLFYYCNPNYIQCGFCIFCTMQLFFSYKCNYSAITNVIVLQLQM